jgi:hypothetical protein
MSTKPQLAWESVWINNGNKNSFTFNKKNGKIETLSLGNWIKLPNRNDKVIIDKIYSLKDTDIGPVGISYLPWRYNEQKFANVEYSMRGNVRFIVCYPTGLNTYGHHIDWDNLELCEPPDNIIVEKMLTITNI